jgi:predicted lipase
VYNAVNQVINTHGTSTVTVIGQSLGGALSMLDAVSLRLQLPSNIGVKFIGFGVPRVGNQDWADFVDEKLPGNITRVTNQKDPIPTTPGRFLGYHHPSGEIHIQDSGTGVWVVCTGQENDSSQCSNGEVKTIFSGMEADHDGPYNGIMIAC